MSRPQSILLVCLTVLAGLLVAPPAHAAPRFNVLVFSKVNGFFHDSIPAGKAAITQLGQLHNFAVTVSDDATIISDAGLAPFDAVIFNNTNGRDGAVLNGDQRAALQRYVRAGHGFTGIHSASGSDRDWPWYDAMLGAKFTTHPAIQQVAIQVDDRVHPSTKGLPQNWIRTEEPYDFNVNPRGNVHVLASFDTRSYTGHTLGADHPISWCQNFEGGRSWYTALGHDSTAYDEPFFRSHLLGGIEWAAGAVPGDCGPTENERYEKITLDDNTDDPLDMEIDSTGRVFFVERGGAIKVYDPTVRLAKLAAKLDVFVVHTHGMHGIALDPNFATNHFLYIYYTPLNATVNRISRFTFDEATDTVDKASEKVLITTPSQRQVNAHEGGGMKFDRNGNLYIATGDNATPCCSGFAPIDDRPGFEPDDARRSSANTNDLRGKILRVHPEPGGTYTIPAGNLFPPGTAQTRPEIYAMGLRNPYRIHIDQETNWLYWGEVGPDARVDTPSRGPRGYDEFNQARSAGNFGWPMCIAGNLSYVDFDFATNASGAPFDCAGGPVNDSRNNTGLRNLPPARGAWLPYPYDLSSTWPELGTGGRLAIGGPMYHFDPNLNSENKFPAYYDDTMLIADWTRNAIFEVKQDAAGQPFSINRFMPGSTFLRPIDMEFGPDGSLYLIEWGTNYGGSGRGDPNFDSAVYKINYVRPGERSPISKAGATPRSGRAPLTVNFTSAGSTDPDAGQALNFAWDFDGNGTTDSTAVSPSHTYTANGDYTARLTVTDPTNRSTVANVPITVGNTAPTVTLSGPADGQIFDFGGPVPFSVSVTDPEDSAAGTIDCQQVITQPALGHAQHAHPLEQYRGCSGTIQSIVDSGHTSNDNIFYVVDSKYTDRGANGVSRLTGGDSAILQPRHKEADHYTRQNGTNLFDTQDGTGGKLVGNISNGDWVSYEPVNLAGVDAIRLRVASAGAGGFLDVRLDSPTGPQVGSVTVPVTGGWRTWATVTADITDPGGSHELYLVARNASSTADLFNLDSLYFAPQIEAATLTLPTPLGAGRSATATVAVANRTASAANATVRLTVPAGWTTTPVTTSIAAGATANVAVQLTPPAQSVAAGRLSEVDISAQVSVPGQLAGGIPHARTFVAPAGQDAVYALDAGSATSPLVPGYSRLDPGTMYSTVTGFGWIANAGLEFRDRGGPDAMRRDMVTSRGPATLRLLIPAGRHQVSLLRGDSQFDARRLIVTANGQQVVGGGIPLAPNQWGWEQFTLDGGPAGRVVDLQFSIDIQEFWRVNAIVVSRLPVSAS
jgi:cytochrome c